MSTHSIEESSPQAKKAGVISLGLALFSMYFGAGNLIFPMIVGNDAGSNNIYAVLGLALTSVFFPLLGLYSIMLYDGDHKPFFGRLGRKVGGSLYFSILMVVGPLYVVPRLFSLMWGSVQNIAPDTPKLLFLILTVAGLFFSSQKNSRMIQILSYVLTPVFLLAIFAIIVLGLYHPPAAPQVASSAMNSFKNGFMGGYATMDLIASFLFASAILPTIKEGAVGMEKKAAQKYMGGMLMKSGIFAAFLLMITYAGLSFVFAHHGQTIPHDLPQEMWLGFIATSLIGTFGSTVASVTVIIACFTTAMALISIFSNYMSKEVFKEKYSVTLFSVGALICAAFVGNLNFEKINDTFAPFLQVIYPGLIILCFLNIAHKLKRFPMVKIPVLSMFGYGIYKKLLPFLS